MDSISLINRQWPDKRLLGTDVFDFLAHLEGPTLIHISGRDRSRCRVLVTLLHGNEPSGLKALHKILQQNLAPAVNIKVIIASVQAASRRPFFTHRMLPGDKDLNRCFGVGPASKQGLSKQEQLAATIAETIAACRPEAVIDLHNTSGDGPGFTVSVKGDAKHKQMASYFSDQFIQTDIQLGSLMEQDFDCPVITVEAGGGHNKAADQLAYKGLCAYFSSHDLFKTNPVINVITNPRRLEIKADSVLCFDNARTSRANVTMRADIESFNFGLTPKNTRLGWLDDLGLEHFALDKRNELLALTFRIEDGCLVTNTALSLFMITTRVDIAKSDCLFYFAPAQ